MAGAFEQTIIVGNVGNSPDTRFTQSGTPVANFSVAVSNRWTDSQTGEVTEKTNWYKVTAWRGLAEVVGKYVKKGMSVMVVGTVEASAYMGQDGNPRASLDLTARDIQFLNRAEGDGTSVDPASGNITEDVPFAPEGDW